MHTKVQPPALNILSGAVPQETMRGHELLVTPHPTTQVWLASPLAYSTESP
jgi:hypothetical protein